MNLNELQTVQSKERRKDSLQHLRDAFYEDVAGYISDLKAERKEVAATADDPFSSPEVSRLTDEIETAEEVVEAVYERRVGKVVKLASFAAADMPVDEEGMTTQERELFEDLVARIEQNKTTVLDILSGNGSASASEVREASGSRASESDPTAPDAAPVGGTGADDTDAGTPATADEESTPDVLSQAMDGERDLTVGDDESVAPAPDASTGRVDAGDPDTVPADGDGVADATGNGPKNADGDDTPPTPPDTPGGGTGTDGETGSETEPASGRADDDRTTVRITRDVGSILGVDEREYDLAEEDVVTLPSANAEPLVQRDAAERLD
ncbi:hypothetical protein ACFO0N_03675 [Halobium salinum]|uniref:Gins51 C-terminal domain-containing protein n=1 Tax=Halobium salinum TaxID=1364940 RepID=A0ABD5P8F7_9EURY|nr:hypothetical protein [Halobium salinum]